MSLHRLALATVASVCALSGGTAGGAPSKSVIGYSMDLGAKPQFHQMSVTGEMRVAARRGTIETSISSAATRVHWLLPAGWRAVRVRADNGPDSNPAAGDQDRWRLVPAKGAPPATRIGFSYLIETPVPAGFLYIGPECLFGVGNWYPQISETIATGTIRLRLPAGWVAGGSGTTEALRGGAARGTARIESTTAGAMAFAAAPASSSVAQVSPALSLIRLRQRPDDASWNEGLKRVSTALQGEFGPLPYPHVSVFEVPDQIGEKAGFGAFAAPGLVLARSQFFDQPFNVAAFAHEFTHLWWGNFLSLAGKKGDFLLDEGLAQYGAITAVEQVLGNEAAARMRARGFPGFNQRLYSALGYLEIASAGLDRPLLELGDDGLSYWLAYSKAGLVWYALADYVGGEKFKAALRSVLKRHGPGFVSWDETVAALAREGGPGVRPFVSHWFGEAGAPCYEPVAGSDPASGIQIHQCDVPKPAALDVQFALPGGGTETRRVRVSQVNQAVPSPPIVRPGGISLDPDYRVLRWTPELRREAQALAPYMRALVLVRLGKKDEAETVLKSWLASDPSRNDYDRLLLAHSSLARLAEDRQCKDCAIAEIRLALAERPIRKEELAPNYLALALQARRLGERSLAERAAQLAVECDGVVDEANGVALKLQQ